MKWEKLKYFSLRSGTRQEWTFLSCLLSIVLEVIATVICQKEGKDMQIEKGEVKISPFADDNSAHRKTPKESIKRFMDKLDLQNQLLFYMPIVNLLKKSSWK